MYKKKVNFMEEQQFQQTKEALEQFKESLNVLKNAVEGRKNALFQQKEAYKNNMAAKNEEILRLKNLVASAAEKVSNCVLTIDEVLKENGSGNNSN